MNVQKPIDITSIRERVAPLTAEQLAEIRAREAAATPGPWRWAGNVDHEDPRLTSGRRDILGTVPRERERGDRDARRYAEYLRECEFEDQPGGVERVGDEVVVKAPTWRHLTDDEIEQRVREEWLLDRWGQPAKDDRLAFVDDALIYRTARRLAVFEVCPEATDRDDPRVYRADIVGVRHPDAEFIAHARQDVADLLAEVEELRAKVARHGNELRDKRTDLLNVRGILSPNGRISPLPPEVQATLGVGGVAPAVEWLVAELARLRAAVPPEGISVGRGDDGTVSIEWDRDGRTTHVMVDPRGAVDVYAELPEGEQERAYLLPNGGVWLTEYAHRNGPDEKLSNWSTARPTDARLAECAANGCVSRRVWYGPVEPVAVSDTTETTS